MGLTVVTKDEPKLTNIADCEPGDIIKWEGDYWIVSDNFCIVSLTRGSYFEFDIEEGYIIGESEDVIYAEVLEKAVLYPYGND